MTLPREVIGPDGSNCTQGWSVPEFLSKPIATCDFPEGSGPRVPTSGSAHGAEQAGLSLTWLQISKPSFLTTRPKYLSKTLDVLANCITATNHENVPNISQLCPC